MFQLFLLQNFKKSRQERMTCMEGVASTTAKRWRIVFYIILGLLLVMILGYFFIQGYIKKSMPQVEGEIAIPVAQDVTVITDEDGVPHIEAESLQDLYTAQGYVQAQSRMLQMDLSRRQASGTLSELIGKASLDSDKYFRTLGLRRAAEKSLELYSDDELAVLEWFSEGVNAYIEEATENGTLPIEYRFIGAEPMEWTPLDSLTIGKYMAFDLGGHWERQAFNMYALDTFSEEKAEELFPNYPKDRMNIIDDAEIDIAASFEDAIIPEPFNGSNNWVVDGEKTATGKPLLADDPHLGLATPSIWYQMHLQAGDMNVSGVIFAGVPGIILGHNADVAWGVTNTGPDVQQLYLEKRNPDNADEFLFEDEWEEADIISEPIDIKGEETLDYEVVETRHGPVVSEFAAEDQQNDVLSLSWTALDATKELQAILDINQATNWKEFEKGLENFHAPTQSFVFADADGTIAMKANGKIPIYEEGEDALLPLPGWEEKYVLDKYIPFDELPTVINPEKGFIATANNKMVGDTYPYHISNVWAQPYRYERIHDVLEENNELTIDDMQALQMDAVNLRAEEFVPVFLESLQEANLSKSEQTALNSLTSWNYEDSKHKKEPLIFDRVIQKMEASLYEELSDEVMDLFSARGQTTDHLLRLGDESEWIKEQGGMNALIETSFKEAISELEKTYGTNQKIWQWGDYHQVQFKHPLSSAGKFVASIFNKKQPIPVDGSDVTPMAARHNGEGLVDHGASWRFVIDLDDITNGYHTVGPGQSGHLLSPWYSDQTEDWVEGNYHETPIENNTGFKLTLVPQED